MTTTDAVTASRARLGSARSRKVFAALALALAAGVAGCGTNSVLGENQDQTQSLAQQPLAAKPQPVSQAKVALAPIVGAPEALNKQMTAQLGASLEKQRVVLAKTGEKADYTLRGYMVAAKEKTGTKLSYIWDLTDPAGKRANRIQGEEIVKGGDGKDPWSAVTDQVAQSISDKTATSLAAQIASLQPAAATSSAPVGVGAPANQAQATPPSQPVQTASLPAGSNARVGNTALVAAVSGAPGDGNTALTEAMRQELQTAGITIAQTGQPGYLVAGKVTVGAAKEGKQPIRIDWKVSDPSGATLATVTQNNEIAAGALDGQWGAIANDAAQGASVKIKALIDESQTGVSAARGPVRREAKKT